MTPVNPAGNGTRSMLTSDGHYELFLVNGMHMYGCINQFRMQSGLWGGGGGGGSHYFENALIVVPTCQGNLSVQMKSTCKRRECPLN